MGLLDKFTKRSNLDPLQRLVQDSASSLENKFENAVEDLFASTLRNAGLSSSISQELSSRFGDALKYELADKYFQTSTTEYNRVSREDICSNFLPSYSDTASGSATSIKNKLKDISDTNKQVLQYPSQLGKYYITMQFRRFVRQAPQVKSSLEFDNAIVLPVPRKLEDNFDIKVSEKSMGVAGGINDAIQTISSGAKEDYSPTTAIAFTAMSALIGELDSNVQDTLSQYLGSIPNPHVTAIFDGVDLRQHSFDWTFAPRNVEESVAIQNIVLKLKQNSLPAFSTIGTPILQYPLMCQIRMEPWHSQGAELIKYKPALLQSVKVNYSPNGIPSFFAGTNLPTFIQISLQFIETTYFTSNDFGREGFEDSGIESIIDSVDSIAKEVLPTSVYNGVKAGFELEDDLLTGQGIKK